MAHDTSINVQDVIRRTLYSESRLEPDDEVNEHLPVIVGPRVVLVDKVALCIVADNAGLKAEGRRDYRRSRVERLLVPFGLKVAGHHGTRAHEEYQRIFTIAPSAIAAATKTDFPGFVTQLQTEIQSAKTTPDLKKAGAPLCQAIAEFLKAEAEYQASQKAFKAASDQVEKGKTACLDGLARLRGLLVAKYPRQPKVVAGFFRKNGKKVKKVKVELVGV